MRYIDAPCTVCGQTCRIPATATRPCRMTPRCEGRHQAPHRTRLADDNDTRHRVDDAPTPRLAARRLTPGRLSAGRRTVLETLRQLDRPATDHDIAEYSGMLLGSASKRRCDLLRLGYVAEEGRGVSPSGVAATRWRLTPDGIAALQEVRRGA